MPLTVKERQRRFRKKLKTDPERFKKFKKKERKRYHDNKAVGIVKLINEKPERAQRNQRRRWRKNKQRQRQKLKDVEKQITPPASPANDDTPSIPSCSHQKIRAQKKRNINKAKCYRDNLLLEKKMENGNRTIDMLRKKLKRSTTNKKADTPRTKTRKLLRHFGKVDSNVRKTLTFHYTIMQQIREKYRKSRQKRIICATIIGRITRKYKFNCILRRELGVGCRVNRTRKRGTISTRLRNEVHAFFERDDNSRITTGVKQTITRNKVKRQKRLMLDTLRHLFSKYQSESNQVISFTTFFRLKPFWVKCPTEKDREICLCKTCENLGFMIKELFRNNVISTTSMCDMQRKTN